jgi:PST family polysaccharide transporter
VRCVAEQVEESLGKKSTSGAAWAGISRGIQQGTQTLSVGFLARSLSADDYGLMSMSNFFVNFLQQLGDLGTGSAIVQREQVSPRLVSSLFWMNFLLGLVGAILLWASAPLMALYYKEPRVILPLSILALSFPLAGLGIVPQSLLVRNMEYRKLAIVEVGAAVMAALVSVVLAWNGAGVWSLVAGSLTMAVISSLLGWFYSGWLPMWVLDWGEIRSVFGFSMNLTGFVMFNYFARNTGHLIVGRYLGAAALGYYQMAYSLLLYPLQAVSSVLGRVMFAAFSRMQADPERFRLAIQRYLTLLGAVTFPVFFGMMVVAAPMITLFLGKDWLPVIPLFMIVAPFGALHSISSPTGQIYISNGRTDVMFKMGVIATVIQVAGYFAGLPWGLEGVLLGWAISSVPVALGGIYVSHRLIHAPIKPLLRGLWPPAVAALAMAVVAWGWRMLISNLGFTNMVFDLVSTILVGAIVYLVLVLLPRPAFMRDIVQILSYSDNAVFARLRTGLERFAPAEE